MVNRALSPNVHNVTKAASNAEEKEANLLLSSGVFVMNHFHYGAAHWKAAGFSFSFGHSVGLANISVFWEGGRVREESGCCPCRR